MLPQSIVPKEALLVVDDDASMRRVVAMHMRRKFDQNKYQVIEADNMLDAVGVLSTCKVAALCTDIGYQVMGQHLFPSDVQAKEARIGTAHPRSGQDAFLAALENQQGGAGVILARLVRTGKTGIVSDATLKKLAPAYHHMVENHMIPGEPSVDTLIEPEHLALAHGKRVLAYLEDRGREIQAINGQTPIVIHTATLTRAKQEAARAVANLRAPDPSVFADLRNVNEEIHLDRRCSVKSLGEEHQPYTALATKTAIPEMVASLAEHAVLEEAPLRVRRGGVTVKSPPPERERVH